jgi:hypothetical protein
VLRVMMMCEYLDEFICANEISNGASELWRTVIIYSMSILGVCCLCEKGVGGQQSMSRIFSI